MRAPIAELGKRWPPASFDVVVCHQVFDRSFEPRLVLETLTGAVRAGGHLSLAFQDRASAPFEATRIHLQDTDTGALILLDVTAEAVEAVYQRRAEARGLKMIYEPKYLRFFQARFEPL